MRGFLCKTLASFMQDNLPFMRDNMYCKKRNRNCRYAYKQNSYQCKKCVEDNLSQYPVTCEDCRYSWYDCYKRGKNQRKMRPCEDFKWS